MNLGESIYRLRTRQQLSQGDLADALTRTLRLLRGRRGRKPA